MKRLYELLDPYIFNYPEYTILIDMQLNSEKITLGSLFIAVKGHDTDGRLYINHAIKKGAAAVFLEFSDHIKFTKMIHNIKRIPIICLNYLHLRLSNIAGRFYDHPSSLLNLVGVTGTNGKTTVVHLLANWIKLLGEKSALMGTLGNGTLDNLLESTHTTSSAIDVQKMLFQFVQNKVTFVAMEVSSHGLAQHRVDALYFNVAIFTNLSNEHLDYHKDIIQYAMMKKRFFNKLNVENYVINADDKIGYEWLLHLPQAVAVTVKNNLPVAWKGKWMCAKKIIYHSYVGTDIFFDSSWGPGMIHSRLLGICNVINVLLALSALLVLGYPLFLLLRVASFLKSVRGRMEVFRSCNYPKIIVDYAHNPDALEQALISIKTQNYYRGRLWCVFGCGGDRDKSKRALMGVIVERYADYIIITNDNPRTEDPQSIVDDITRDIIHTRKIIRIIKNRVCAIITAISEAHLEDLVFIAGKGHEEYQIIGSNRIYCSDRDTIKNFLKNSYYDSV